MTDGAPDLLVNNAGLFKLSPVESTSPEDFSSSLDINLVRAVPPHSRVSSRHA